MSEDLEEQRRRVAETEARRIAEQRDQVARRADDEAERVRQDQADRQARAAEAQDLANRFAGWANAINLPHTFQKGRRSGWLLGERGGPHAYNSGENHGSDTTRLFLSPDGEVLEYTVHCVVRSGGKGHRFMNRPTPDAYSLYDPAKMRKEIAEVEERYEIRFPAE